MRVVKLTWRVGKGRGERERDSEDERGRAADRAVPWAA